MVTTFEPISERITNSIQKSNDYLAKEYFQEGKVNNMLLDVTKSDDDSGTNPNPSLTPIFHKTQQISHFQSSQAPSQFQQFTQFPILDFLTKPVHAPVQ